MVKDRDADAHQLPGTTGSNVGSQMLCKAQARHVDPPDNTTALTYINKFGGTVSPELNRLTKELWLWCLDRNITVQATHLAGALNVTGILCDEGQVRLDALPKNLHESQPADRTTTGVSVCITTDLPATGLSELETRPPYNGNERLHPGLDKVPGICKPTVEHGGQGTDTCQTSEGKTSTSDTSLEIPDMVPTAIEDGNAETAPVPELTQSDPTDSQSQPTRHNPAASRVGYLRDRFRSQKFSEEASELLLASWRQKSAKTYDSLFKKWLGWCSERGVDPISGDIAEVVNFLAHLFQQGYQYRSLNSAISSVHEKIDGYEVGQHPLVTRLIKGAFRERPPQPRYSETWDVSKVTSHLDSLGNTDQLSLQDLTFKTVIFMALTRPSDQLIYTGELRTGFSM